MHEHGFEQRHGQVLVDVCRDEEPACDAAKDLQWLAEEERRLQVVAEQQRRHQAGRGQHMPQAEHSHQHACLPNPQVSRPRTQALPHADHAVRCSCCW
jgi:hypothetical protein